MKEDNYNVPKGNQIFLAVVGIVTIVVAVLGATYAYFSANSVTGNAEANNISALTATYGDITVEYPGASTISMGIVDLPYGGTDALGLMKFTVGVSANANVDQRFSISWSGTTNITNDFTQYVKPDGTTSETDGYMCYGGSATGAENETACAGINGASWTRYTDVRDEIVYTLFSCSSAGFNSITTTSHTNCVAINTPDVAETDYTFAPYTSVQKNAALAATQTIDISNSRTNYYALLLTIRNKITTQNYNQGKNFTGSIVIQPVAS